jgi:hypothetical protein
VASPILTADFDSKISVLIEYLLGLHGEADSHFGATIENFKDAIADQATKVAAGPLSGDQFDTAIASLAPGTSDIGLSHVRYSTIFYPLQKRQPERSPGGHAPDPTG